MLHRCSMMSGRCPIITIAAAMIAHFVAAAGSGFEYDSASADFRSNSGVATAVIAQNFIQWIDESFGHAGRSLFLTVHAAHALLSRVRLVPFVYVCPIQPTMSHPIVQPIGKIRGRKRRRGESEIGWQAAGVKDRADNDILPFRRRL